MEIAEPMIGAMRGRNPDNPSERAKSNGKYKQRLEMNENGTSNTITSVQKDNLVVEPTSNSFECNNFVLGSMQKNAYKGTTDGVSPAITAACGMGGGQTHMVGNSFRIRKLTPRECFRLMGVDDADIDKLMSAGISNSQLYKCAGNSIVVDTLYHLFRKLFCDKESEEATYQQTLF